jgi:hypothetical protein
MLNSLTHRTPEVLSLASLFQGPHGFREADRDRIGSRQLCTSECISVLYLHR